MHLTFRQFFNEGLVDDAKKVAAGFLDTTTGALERVDAKTSAEVLDKGREINQKIIKVASGALVIRAFKALGTIFARIEAPDGNQMFKAPVPKSK